MFFSYKYPFYAKYYNHMMGTYVKFWLIRTVLFIEILKYISK